MMFCWLGGFRRFEGYSLKESFPHPHCEDAEGAEV